jgi:pyridoxamine 5'-phosphate oxidase
VSEATLSPASSAADPFDQFVQWFDEGAPHRIDPDAMALATTDAEGHPSLRMVLVRLRATGRFGWFTHYESRKGRDLLAAPHGALLWFCEPLHRQIRIEGPVVRASASESDAYFASRPRGHQLSAWASPQSERVADRHDLEIARDDIDARFPETVPRPPFWGGYVLTPTSYEFWQQRRDRVHDRVRYDSIDGAWVRSRLAP